AAAPAWTRPTTARWPAAGPRQWWRRRRRRPARARRPWCAGGARGRNRSSVDLPGRRNWCLRLRRLRLCLRFVDRCRTEGMRVARERLELAVADVEGATGVGQQRARPGPGGDGGRLGV